MWTAPAAATPAKRRNRRSFKDLMLRRRRKSRDDEPIGVLFERDLDEICQHGTLPPSLTVSKAQRMGVFCTGGWGRCGVNTPLRIFCSCSVRTIQTSQPNWRI